MLFCFATSLGHAAKIYIFVPGMLKKKVAHFPLAILVYRTRVNKWTERAILISQRKMITIDVFCFAFAN